MRPTGWKKSPPSPHAVFSSTYFLRTSLLQDESWRVCGLWKSGVKTKVESTSHLHNVQPKTTTWPQHNLFYYLLANPSLAPENIGTSALCRLHQIWMMKWYSLVKTHGEEFYIWTWFIKKFLKFKSYDKHFINILSCQNKPFVWFQWFYHKLYQSPSGFYGWNKNQYHDQVILKVCFYIL